MVSDPTILAFCDTCGGSIDAGGEEGKDWVQEGDFVGLWHASCHPDAGCWHCHSKDNAREDDGFCRPCHDRYGWHLLKASSDPFDYAMRLTSGDLIYFQSLEIHGDWVMIAADDIGNFSTIPATKNPPWERGLQIRIDAIAWIADAPYGS